MGWRQENFYVKAVRATYETQCTNRKVENQNLKWRTLDYTHKRNKWQTMCLPLFRNDFMILSEAEITYSPILIFR